MKKMLKAMIAMLIMSVSFRGVYANTPLDIQRSWARDDINTLMSKSIMTGYSDGRFRPQQDMSRQEVAIVINRAIEGLSVDRMNSEDMINFSDIQNSYAQKEISSLVAKGVLTPNLGERFRPFDYATREEAADLIFKITQKIEENNNNNNAAHSQMSDSDLNVKHLQIFDSVLNANPINLPIDIEDSLYYEAIKRLYEKGILSGTPEGFFYPRSFVKRGEFAAMLRRAMGYDVIALDKILPDVHTINVPYISQYYPVSAPVGCEGTALLMALKAKGYAGDIGLKAFLDNMPKAKSDPSKGFVGSPYVIDWSKKTRTTIFPNKLAEFGSQYGRVFDFTGANLNQIQSQVLKGNPVVVYMTMNYEEPFYREYNIEGTTKRLLSNNHAVLLAGYDSIRNHYFIVDPKNTDNLKEPNTYWLSGEIFEDIYTERNHAVVIE